MTQRILVVDDEPDFLDVMSEFLEEQGYAVATALNGSDALKKLAGDSFSLLISDINMPGMKGFELLYEASLRYPGLKRVLITAYDVRDYLAMAKNYDIGNIITKTTPFNFDEIAVLIDNILSANIFGLDKYIRGAIHRFRVTTNDDIATATDEVLDFMHNDRDKRKFRQAMGEIVVNAFFYGAKNEDPEKKYTWRFDATLPESDTVLVSWGRDSEKSGIAVTDRKGRLAKKDVIYWLERNTTRGEDGLALGLTDCHGKGLFITREMVDRMIINIDPGKITEIIMINYEEGLYDGHRPLWIQEL